MSSLKLSEMIGPSIGVNAVPDVLSRKTCRRCFGALFEGNDSETFPVAGIGTMHKQCALDHCQENDMTLQQAIPVCKHWRTRGYCIYQASTPCSQRFTPLINRQAEVAHFKMA